MYPFNDVASSDLSVDFTETLSNIYSPSGTNFVAEQAPSNAMMIPPTILYKSFRISAIWDTKIVQGECRDKRKTKFFQVWLCRIAACLI